MSEVNIDWVKQQFVELKVKKGVGLAVLDMLKAWEPIDLNTEDAKTALYIFSKVALGHAVVETPSSELWAPGGPGMIRVADVVRVRADAFDGLEGVGQNGRVCVVTAVRSGDVIVKSTDGKQPFLDGAHYRPTQLEKRIR